MFSISLLPDSIRGPEGQRLGEIVIDDFREKFACFANHDSFVADCRNNLHSLIEGKINSIALIYDPRFAWIIYRENLACYVQQVFAQDGDFTQHLKERKSISEEGDRISEWKLCLSDINEYLKQPNQAIEPRR